MARIARKTRDQPLLDSDRTAELVHDIRHCLHVLRIGRELLATLDDSEKRQEVCQCMALEEEKTTALLDQLVEIVRGHTT